MKLRHVREQSCYYGTITRKKLPNKSFEYAVEKSKCIGCGFCAGICPVEFGRWWRTCRLLIPHPFGEKRVG